MTIERPRFIGNEVFSWQGRGYRFSETPWLPIGRSLAEADDPWIMLAGVLEQAKAGKFDEIELLFKAIHGSDNAVLWRAAFEVMGDAGSSSFLKSVLDKFAAELWDKPDPIYQRHVAYTLAQSHLLWTVPVLLDFHLTSTDRRETGIITLLLSRLLETEPGAIALGIAPDNEYRQLVEQKYKEIRLLTRTDEVPVLAGGIFSIRGVIERLFDILRSPNRQLSDIRYYRHILEASTGTNCNGFFSAGELQSQTALSVVEEFLINGGLANYEDGVRYFYSHRIEI